jgi:hypothetical protein
LQRVVRIIALTLLALVVGGAVTARAQQATPAPFSAAELGYPELTIKVTDDAVEMPASVPAGRYLVTLTDATDHGLDAFLMRLPEGMTAAEVDAAFASPPTEIPDWYLQAVLAGGPTVSAGRTGQTIADLTPGQWLVIGNGHPTQTFAVTGDLAAPIAAPDPTADATVTLQEYAFVGLDAVKPGRQIWKVTNTGTQPHFMELIKVPAGTTMDQIVQVLMAGGSEASPVPGGLDPAQVEGVGGIGALSVGMTGWYVTDLEPGTYAALCFIPDKDTLMPHALMGMIQVFAVQ